MRIAWLTHHLPWPEGKERPEFLLPGELVGGAEMADMGMINQGPDDADITMLPPDCWEEAMDYERIVITGTDYLTPEAMLTLAERGPLVWVHHQQAASKERNTLFRQARPFVTMSTLHQWVEERWSGVKSEINHGWIDPAEVPVASNERRGALWSARNHPAKGLISARLWALREGHALKELTGVPRAEVLWAMSEAEWFVFKPKSIDACPRTLIEAEIAGCKIATNALAGRRASGDLTDVLTSQPVSFWRWV